MGGADDVGQQPGGRHPGVHPEPDERRPEPGSGRGVAQVAGEREAQPGPDRVRR